MVIALVGSKPTEEDFSNRILRDYSQIHPGFKLTKSDLLQMGNSRYQTELLYSTYTYQFGTIEVYYCGIFGVVFNGGYKNDNKGEAVESV